MEPRLDRNRSVCGAEIAIVIPPFAGIDRPSLGAHLLQACAGRAGIAVDVVYANLEFAARIGERVYEAIAYAPSTALAGERLFAGTAYRVPPLGRSLESARQSLKQVCAQSELTFEQLQEIEQSIASWIRQTAHRLCQAGYQVIGCSTTFEQTAASVALLRAIKDLEPRIVTILGGANCEGPMAEGLVSLEVAADYIFRGECETSFVEFLRNLRRGVKPAHRIISGSPCADLDSLPLPDFSQFFDQAETLAEPGSGFWLTYESSRGCWWGAKQHCTFCGLNAEGMASREKSPDRVIADLRLLQERHGSQAVCLTDNIMPHTYFRTLIPRLGEELPGLRLFYEVKANLSLGHLRALVGAGIGVVQPGIESLSTRLLGQMRKGVTARQNLALLRDARAVGLELRWNLLYGLPGDEVSDYESPLRWMPLLHHLEPPQGVFPVTIDRFSPYHFAAESFGIRRLRPADSYVEILPESARISEIAYHFDGDFESGSRSDPELIERFRKGVACWRDRWRADSRPVLAVLPVEKGSYLLFDSRGLDGCSAARFLDGVEAAAAVVSVPLHAAGDEHRRARDGKLAIEVDGWHVGLATADPHVLELLRASNIREETTARSGPQ